MSHNKIGPILTYEIVFFEKDSSFCRENKIFKAKMTNNLDQCLTYHPNKENYQINSENIFFGTVTGVTNLQIILGGHFVGIGNCFYRPKFSVI